MKKARGGYVVLGAIHHTLRVRFQLVLKVSAIQDKHFYPSVVATLPVRRRIPVAKCATISGERAETSGALTWQASLSCLYGKPATNERINLILLHVVQVIRPSTSGWVNL